MKKRVLSVLCMLVITFSMVGCASKEETNNTSKETPTQITITDVDGTKVTVPYNAEKIAVLDYASLDIIDSLGLGDKVVAIPKSSSVAYLSDYVENENIIDTGSVKEVDYEALMSAEPELIIVGGRLSGSIEELSKYAPTILVKINEENIGYIESVTLNVKSIASIYGIEDKATKLLEDFNVRLDSISNASEGKTALVGLVSGGALSLYGGNERFSIISKEAGFTNLKTADDEANESSHGDFASFEVVLDKNPEYLFIVDRDSVVGGGSSANDVMENAIIKQTTAYTNENIVYLTGDVWYLASGGIEATNIMLTEIENCINK